MNTTDYIQEAQRQLINPEHYKPLTSDPKTTYNKYIHHLRDQSWRLEIINDTTKENLQTKNPRISTFYMLPKIHKPGNPGRPIVNSIGSITEKFQHLWMLILENKHSEYLVTSRTLHISST